MKIATSYIFWLLLVACSPLQQATDTASNDIVQGDVDPYEYRYLRLPNQLQVLLVSDPEADKAAASLDVNVGSSSDPGDREGLAHFLEHMLFLGTDKYPDSGEYQTFISEHGGSHNAYTAFEHTNYFFDVDAPHIEQALDRFSRFFVAPLFNEAYVEREKHAVHSEYKAKIKDDYRRQLDAFRRVVNPAHPASLFSVGNLDTLADRPGSTVREDLLEFYQRHYVADKMSLTLLAPLSLDQLELLVRQRFSEIADANHQAPASRVPFFEPGQLPKLLKVQPEQELRQLIFLFPMASPRDYWREKPLAFLGNLLGHEGEGSLLALLKRKGWAESLGAGEGLADRHNSIFQISVGVTREGVDHWQEIASLLFSEIALVRQAGLEQWRYREQGLLADMQFRHREKINPIQYVRQLSARLHDYPYREVLRGPYLMDQYDEALIRRFLGALTPENMLLTLVAPEAETDKTTQLYSVPYSLQALEVSEGWLNPAADSQLILPAENPFVPTRFDLVHSEKTAEPLLPELVASKHQYRLWHSPDSFFQVPKGQFYVSLKTPAVSTARGVALTELYIALVEEALNETAYAATLAGIGYDISGSPEGFEFIVSGFDDRLPVLVSHLVAGLTSPELQSEHFQRVKRELIRQLRNMQKDPPYRQAIRELSSGLIPTKYHPLVLANLIENTDQAVFEVFYARLFDGVSLEMLASGNLDIETARALALEVVDHLPLIDSVAPLVPREVVKLASGIEQRQLKVEHKDQVIVRYYQGRGDGYEEAAQFMLLRQLLKSPFFNQLRTEQQLGYIVAAVDMTFDRVPGIGFLVQSPVASPEKLARAVDSFLVEFEADLHALSEEEFERNRQAVLASLEEKPKNLAELSSRYWGSIGLRYFDFNTRQQIAATLMQLSLEDVKKAYGEVLLRGASGLQVTSGDHAVNKSAAIPADRPVFFTLP